MSKVKENVFAVRLTRNRKYVDTKDMNGIASFMTIALWLLTFLLFLWNDYKQYKYKC